MNRVLVIVALFVFFATSSYSANPYDKYKNRMNQSSTTVEESDPAEHTPPMFKEQSSMESDIQDIKNMKQGQFESSASFEYRVDEKLLKLKRKIEFFAQNGLKEFSAGTVTMKSYDADNEIMKLSLNWNKSLYALFPEIKKWKKATLFITRNEAKRLFEKKDTHYFHIYFIAKNKKIAIDKMMLYNKYAFTVDIKKKVPFQPKPVKSVRQNEWVPHQNTVASCSYYYTNASSINVRSRPTTRSVRKERLNINKKVCVTKRNGSWYYIQNKGWILSKYLSKTKTKRKRKVTKKISSRDRGVWHCTARSVRASGWVERVGKENAKRGALKQCTMRLQTNQPCRIVNCYRL